MQQLRIDRVFPATLDPMLAECTAAQQLQPTPLLLRYGPGGFNALHQDLYGDVYFPLQAAVILNKPGSDFSGGEFVLTQQAARSQARPVVLTPDSGDMIVFATSIRPEQGSRGYHRVNVKHGVSEIQSGSRNTLGIIFHDAQK